MAGLARTSRWCAAAVAALVMATASRGVGAQASSKLSAADSLYRAAREAMVRGDAKSAIQTFRTVAERYPKTNYATAALYYRAYLQYRQAKPNAPAMLRASLATIKQFEAIYPNAPQKSDVRALHLRVCGELAQAGDAECRQELALAARENPQAGTPYSRRHPLSGPQSGSGAGQADTETNVACDNAAAMDNAIGALRNLWVTDSAQAIAQTAGILSLRHPCFVKLRQQAMVMITRRPSATITLAPTAIVTLAPAVFDAARNDPDPTVRNLAGNWLNNQQWDPQAARFLRTIFGHSFRTK